MLERFTGYCFAKHTWLGHGIMWGVIVAVVIVAFLVHQATKSAVLPWMIIGGFMLLSALFVGVMVALAVHFKIPILPESPDGSRKNDD